MKKKILLVILAIIFIAINPVFAARKGAKTVEQLDEVVLETPEEQTVSKFLSLFQLLSKERRKKKL